MQEESDCSESSKQTLNRELMRAESIREEPPNVVVVKEASKICGPQTFLYLTIVNLLSVAIFYLMVSLTKRIPLECTLNCEPNQQQCSCQIGKVSWNTITIVDLTWFSSNHISDQLLENKIAGASIKDGDLPHQLILTPQLEQTCFPNGCQMVLGFYPAEILQGSLFTLSFSTLPQLQSVNRLTARFRQYNSMHLQPSTLQQLTVHFIFAIVVSIYAFSRKHIFQDYSIREREVMGEEKQGGEVPQEVQEMDRQLLRKYGSALEIYKKLVMENGELDYQSEDELG